MNGFGLIYALDGEMYAGYTDSSESLFAGAFEDFSSKKMKNNKYTKSASIEDYVEDYSELKNISEDVFDKFSDWYYSIEIYKLNIKEEDVSKVLLSTKGHTDVSYHFYVVDKEGSLYYGHSNDFGFKKLTSKYKVQSIEEKCSNDSLAKHNGCGTIILKVTLQDGTKKDLKINNKDELVEK